MITLKEPFNSDHVQKVKMAITESFTENQSRMMRFYDYQSDLEDIEEIEFILNMIFAIIIAITMFLCFFSLCASMAANLMD